LLAEFHDDGGFGEGIYKIEKHEAEYATGIYGFAGGDDVNKGGYATDAHFDEHAAFEHPQKGVDILIAQGAGVLEKGKGGEQNEEQVADDEHVGIYAPFGKQGAPENEKGVGDDENDGNGHKGFADGFIIHDDGLVFGRAKVARNRPETGK
jgi:hypothetical protein